MKKWDNAKSAVDTIILFDKFMKNYLDRYTLEEQEYIKKFFIRNIGRFFMKAELLQIYSELGMLPDDINMYQGHADNIKNIFGVDKNILDVASGKIPVFAERVAKEQLKSGIGTITIDEPNLIIDNPKYPNMILDKNFFTEETNIKGYDLITGIQPCTATKNIIDTACKNNKDFYIALCICDHPGFVSEYNIFGEFIPGFQKMVKYAKEMVEKYGLGTLEETYLDDKYNVHIPVIYNKR